MSTITELKNEARSKVHEHLSVRASLYRGDGQTIGGWDRDWSHHYSGEESDSRAIVNVRVHSKPEYVENIRGKAWSERHEDNPKIVFERQDNPQRGDVVCVESGLAYQVHVVKQSVGKFVECDCAKVPVDSSHHFEPPEAIEG